MSLPIALIAGIATQVLCQLFKVFYYSAKERVFSFRHFFTSGGMPSAHSAFVTALGTSIALTGGFASNAFAVCVVFGFIVMHDAYRLRGTVEKQTKIIRMLLAERRDKATVGGAASAGESHPAIAEADGLPAMLGHTPAEIAVGIVVGIGLGLGITLLILQIVG